MVTALNAFDNLYYEVCNEPYFGGVTMEWQHRMIDTIIATETALPRRHLISLNVANGAERVERPPAAVSIFNFHYASPPDAVAMNYELDRAIGDNETGFHGTADAHYRMEGWEFILAGGALFSHLDYSFTPDHEDGSFRYPPDQPGGGGAGFRSQMGVLKAFTERLDVLRMRPDNSIVRGTPPGARVRALAQSNRQYALYLFGGDQGNLTLALPPGRYAAQWVNPLTGAIDREESIVHREGDAILPIPPYEQDVALRLTAIE
jgi:hypothetical protein